jgi:chemotaxis protein MotA
MDIATIIGMAGGLVALVYCVLASGGVLAGIFDAPSLVFVFGGSFLALFNGTSIVKVKTMLGGIGRTFKNFNYGEDKIIPTLVTLASKARREGILSLEEGIEEISDDFTKIGLRLVVDGIDANTIRTIMENDMAQTEARHMEVLSTMNFWGSIGPGFGMMGTVIGLIGMLRNLEDKSSLGPNMAVALITTLYGSLMSNWLLSPWSKKLAVQNTSEMKVKEITIEGVLSIQAGDNPQVLAQKLLTYLSPDMKKKVQTELGVD